jgi:hypothetical protein
MKLRALFVLLPLLGACKEALAPLQGELYVLESIGGDPLPAAYAVNQVSDHRILADTVAFAANGTGVRRTTYDDDAVNGGSYVRDTEFTWAEAGGRVNVSYRCPNDVLADCLPAPHLSGPRTNAALTFDQSAVSRAPLVYRRLFPPD